MMALNPVRSRRLRFLSRILVARLSGSDRSCPYCMANSSRLIGRKHFTLDLRRCVECGLMFRWPKESAGHSVRFYQKDYSEGLTTQIPGKDQLAEMKRNVFKGTEKDFATKIAILKMVVPQGRVLDFGSSWGYGLFPIESRGV